MCFIWNCFGWAIDIAQRLITCALASFLCYVVCITSAVMIGAGMMFGYNYSFSEFLSLNFNNSVAKVGIRYDNKPLPWTFEDQRNWQLLNTPYDVTDDTSQQVESNITVTTIETTTIKDEETTLGWIVTPFRSKEFRTGQKNETPTDDKETLLKFIHPDRMTIKDYITEIPVTISIVDTENLNDEEDKAKEKEQNHINPDFEVFMKDGDNGNELSTLQEDIKIRPIVNDSLIRRIFNIQQNTDSDNTPEDADEDMEVHKSK